MPLTKQQPVDITKKIEDELKVLNEFSENEKTLSISLLDLINSEESKQLINKTANLQKILLKDEDLKIKQAILDLFKEAKNKGLLKQLSAIKEQFEKTNQNKNQINTLINSYKNKHKTDEKIKYIYLRILYKKISIANLVKLKLLTDIIGQNESSVYIKILQNKFSEQGKTGQIAFIHLNNILDPEAEKELRHLADKKSIKRPPKQAIQSEPTTIADPTTTSLPHLKSLSDLSSSSEKNSTSIASQSLDSKHLIEGPSKDKKSKVLNGLLDELNEKKKTIRDLKSSIINLKTEIEQLRKQTKQETHPETAVQAGLKSIKSMLYERHNTAHAEELNKKETLIKDLKSSLKNENEKTRALTNKIEVLNSQHEKVIQELNIQKTDKETDLKDLSEKLNTADQQVQQLNQTLSLVETKKTNLESKLAQLKQENFELQQKLDQGSANDAHLAALQQEKTTNEKELQELKNKLKNLKEKFKNNQTAYRESKEEYDKLHKAFKKQSQELNQTATDLKASNAKLKEIYEELENLKTDIADAKQFNQQELSNSKKEEGSMMNGEVNPPLNNPIYEEFDSSHDTKSKVGPAVLSAKDSDSSSGHSSRNSSSSYLNEDEDPLEYTASQQENNPQQPSSSDEAFSDASSNDLQSLHRSASLKSILSEHNLTHLSDGENVSLNETEDELLKNPDSRPSIPAEPTTSISQQQDQDALLHLDPILEKINNGKALSDEEIAKLPSELQYADTIKEFVSGLRVKYPNLASSYENKINGNTFKKTRLILRKNALNAFPLAAFEEKEILDLSAKLWLEKKLQHITKKSISLTLDERDQKDLDNNFQKYFRLSYLEDMAITHKSIDELKNELKKLHDFKLKITTELSKAFSEIESKLLRYPNLITEDGSFQANLNNSLPLNFPKLSDSDSYPMLSTIQIQILLDKINQHIKNDVSKWSLLHNNNNKTVQEIANNIISDSTNPFESGTDIQRLVSDTLTILYKRHDLQETLEKRKYWDSEIQQRYALTQKLKSSSHFNQMVEDRISKLEEMLNLKENDADENVKALPKAVYLPNKCRIIPNLQFDSSEDAEEYHLQVDNFYKQDALKVGKTITFSQKLANEDECKWSATLNTDKCLSFKTQKKRFRLEKSYLQEVSFAQMVYSVNSFKDAETCTLNFGNCSQNMKERLYLFAKAYNELRLEDNELQKRPKINCNIKNPPNLDKAKIAAVKEEIKAQLNLHSNELEDVSTKLKDDTIRHQIIRSRG